MDKLTDKELYSFLRKINISPEQAKRILSNETLRKTYIPHYYNLYQEMISSAQEKISGGKRRK